MKCKNKHEVSLVILGEFKKDELKMKNERIKTSEVHSCTQMRARAVDVSGAG